MRFLADESCDFSVVRALRAAGHDVLAVSELAPRADDQTVMNLAVLEKRILLTEDKDFGQLIYANARESSGVIFIRFPSDTRKALPQAILRLVKEAEKQLTGSFVVLRPGRVRIGKSPN